MALSQHLTLDNVLKVLLAIAVGVLLYNVFFKKTEGYYNYQSIDKVAGDHAYPMDYEEDESDIPYEEPTEEYIEEVYDEEAEEVYDEEDDIVDEVVLDEAVDEEMYEYEETADEPYDDSVEITEDVVDAEDEIPDEIYEEADAEEGEETGDDITPYNQYEFLYASDVEDGMQENFVLYENDVAEDVGYKPVVNEYLQ